MFKIRNLFLVVFLTATAFSFSGCGTQYTGTYSGQEVVTLQGATSTTPYQVTMQLSQSGSSVTGSYTSASGMTGTLTGTASGNTLTSVTLTMTGGTTSSYAGTTCSVSYQAAVLSFTNNELSGTFTINGGTTATTTSYCSTYSLPASRQVTANKTS